MELALSARIAESFLSKEESRLSADEFARVAAASGYAAVCMRASQVGIHSLPENVAQMKAAVDAHGLRVSMVTGDFDIVYNNDNGPNCLRSIGPYLDLAERLGARLVRVCLKSAGDIAAARQAAAMAGDRGLQLLHQCHVQSLFETVDAIEATLSEIDHPAFGLIFEAANLEECGQRYDESTIRRLSPWIRNVYLQNQVMSPTGSIKLHTWCRGDVSLDIVPIDAGTGINFGRIFCGLKAIGYDGLITVHQSAPDDGSSVSAAAERTARYLKNLWAES